MAELQRYFDKFHEEIKLSDIDENPTLRDKRDMLVKELREKLPSDVPSFEEFNQGSYATNTGINPKDGNYDIDVGLLFDCTRSKYPNPVDLKIKVRDALIRANRNVRIRRHCVTVEYLKDSKPDYHVDLAIYVKRVEDQALDLAVGREFADENNRGWKKSDPKGLVDKIKSRHSGKDGEQFRRCIRYLKRWRDEQLLSNDNLPSIALTCAAYSWFAPYKETAPVERHVDSIALKRFVDSMLSNFHNVLHDGEMASRLQVFLPVEPGDDLLAKMTNSQMKRFKEKLETLSAALREAIAEPLPEKACAILAKQFGDKFPVPKKEETAKSTAAPYVSSGASA